MIHQVVLDAAADGLAVLVASSDLDEALALADRILVVRDHAIAAECAADGDRAAIVAAMGEGTR